MTLLTDLIKVVPYIVDREEVTQMLRERDCHHLFYWRRMYSHGLAKELRSHWYCSCIVPVEPFHRALHREVLLVPVPPAQFILRALKHLRDLERVGAIKAIDSIEKRLAILAVLFDAHPPTREALDAQLKVCKRYPCH